MTVSISYIVAFMLGGAYVAFAFLILALAEMKDRREMLAHMPPPPPVFYYEPTVEDYIRMSDNFNQN